MYFSPLEQFSINSFNILFLSYSSAFFYICILLIFIYLLIYILNLIFLFQKIKLNNILILILDIVDVLIQFIKNLVLNNKGIKFIPLLFTIGITIFLYNFYGAFPYSFTFSSHIIVTLFISFMYFLGINIYGVLKYKKHMFLLFLPNGVPFFMLAPIFMIELLSYTIRTFSLATRLFANLMAGHTLVHILLSFLFMIFTSISGIIFALVATFIPLLIIHMILVLELGVAFLQVYVFFTLCCIYLNDIENVHAH